MRRASWAAICILALIAGTAGADVGSLSLSLTALPTPGTLDVDLNLNATTTGAYSQDSSDYVFMFGSMYYPYPWPGTGSYVSDSDSTVYRTGTTNVFERTFSFTLPHGGTWGTYGFVYGYNTYYNYSTSDSQYGTVTLQRVSAVTTVGLPGLLILGLVLAATGAFILRRA